MRAISLVLAATLALSACGGGAKSITAPRDGDFSVGKTDAPVTVTEYASASCTHCALFNNEVFEQAKAKYVDTGQVHWVMREILTGPEAVSAAGFMVAHCAGPDKAYSVLDAIFRSIGQNPQKALQDDPRGNLQAIALSAGMTEKQFTDCTSDDKALDALKKRVERNSKDGVVGTPTFFVNGVKLDNDKEMTLPRLDNAIAAAKAGKDPGAADAAYKAPK
jgi:protein-disulfide isomerase